MSLLMDVLALFLLWFIFSVYKVACDYPPPELYKNVTCHSDHFKCRPYGSCCKRDSEMCSSLSRSCVSVFLPGEDEDYECCNVLFNNGSARDGLIEVCTYRWRSGSSISREYCKAKYPGEPKGEPPSTTTETKPPPTVVPTKPQQEQVTPSSAKYPEEPKGEPPSTAAETKPPPTVVPTQLQQEQVTHSSEASSDWKFWVGLGVGLGVALILICLMFADKIHLIRDKLIRKCRKARSRTCQREGAFLIDIPSTSFPETTDDKPEEIVIDPEPNLTSGPPAQHEGQAPINNDPPKSEPEPPKDGPENPTSQTEPIPTVNLGNRTLTKAQNSQIGDTAGIVSAETRENGLNDARCPTCQRGGTVSIEISSTSSPETPDDKPEEPAIVPLPNMFLIYEKAICLVELEHPDYSSAETDNGVEPVQSDHSSTETDNLLGERETTLD